MRQQHASKTTRYAIDDGWESMDLAGLLSNYDLRPEVWKINRQRFPNGFEPLVEKAQVLGIGLTLWLPEMQTNYANWRFYADMALEFWRRYGD